MSPFPSSILGLFAQVFQEDYVAIPFGYAMALASIICQHLLANVVERLNNPPEIEMRRMLPPMKYANDSIQLLPDFRRSKYVDDLDIAVMPNTGRV